VQEIRAMEQQAASMGRELMSDAAKAALLELRQQKPQAKCITVVAGGGNNGGDGLQLAALAKQAGLDARVYLMSDKPPASKEAQKAKQDCADLGVTLELFTKGSDLSADVIVDALLGIGLKGEVSASYANAISAINKSDAFVLALDVPSGLDADTGACLGATVGADMTVTFIAMKRGLLTHCALDHCGQLRLCDLGEHAMGPPSVEILSYDSCRHLLAPRLRASHKGNFGHVVIVGGDQGMPGAVRLAGEAALRSGAGLVTVLTHAEHIAAVVSGRPELMCMAVAEQQDISAILAKADVIVVGPGMAESSWSEALCQQVFASDKPLIIDAGALPYLAAEVKTRKNTIITPHPGEAARLLNCTTTEINSDRFAASLTLQQRFHAVTVLKGAGTLVQTPDGKTYICPYGNPGMSSAGMGDVLSGIIAAIVAQGQSLPQAAKLGVIVHGLAGDTAANKGERGLVALDLINALAKWLNP